MARAASSSSQDMSELQEQNENLRAVIKEMREQMEQLGHQIPVSDKNLQPRSADKITEGICHTKLIFICVEITFYHVFAAY